ncbi:MAG: hypothetical protein R3322_06750 [Kiloniellales bacterium]|nr:hypothetical protein [Kiloniellales bacterium]
MLGLRLQALTPQKVAQAYSLIQLVAADVSPAAWRKFAHRRISRTQRSSGGIHTVQNGKGIILGLASYRADVALNSEPVFTVDHLVVVATTERQRNAVLSVLLDAMEDIAASRDYGLIQFRLEASESALLHRYARWLLQAAGHSEKYVLLSKALETSGPRAGGVGGSSF